ncbi:MAG: low molecular weight phosphotyrosine protein phosphatase [Spirochaetaceae bacterium]|nr:low molecular weight phosphotyrosine protein phosphatase [Spirochaetaceae bacterium]
MIKINFICHGNICRSTMAEMIMTYLVNESHTKNLFEINSSATSREEIGNPIHRGTIKILKKNKIPIFPHRAVQITTQEAQKANLLICMDKNNISNLKRIINLEDYSKIKLLLNYANLDRDIADPWYTGNFEDTFNDVLLGCKFLLQELLKVQQDNL